MPHLPNWHVATARIVGLADLPDVPKAGDVPQWSPRWAGQLWMLQGGHVTSHSAAKVSHRRKWYSLNWGVLVCTCGAVGHEEINGNLLLWHHKHKREARRA